MDAVRVNDLAFSYQDAHPVLHIKTLHVAKGEKVFLHGPSGCGKTTLLGLLAGILPAKPGMLRILDQDQGALSSAQRDALRARSIGYIFQIFNLVPYLNVRENILLPQTFGRHHSKNFATADAEAKTLATALGIDRLLGRAVGELSIGQQQRVAAARALFGSPELILADEPTSALDSDARFGFLEALFAQAKREGSAILFVSHDRSLASKFDREISLPEVNAVKGVAP